MKESSIGTAPRYIRMEYCTPLSQTSRNIVSGIVRLRERVASRDEVRKQPLLREGKTTKHYTCDTSYLYIKTMITKVIVNHDKNIHLS